MRTIVITGASSGIGEALALEYAAKDRVIAICGRDRERLESVASACRAKEAEVIAAVVDVRDRAAIAEWLLRIDRQNPVDLLIANAGVIAGATESGGVEDADAAYALLHTNILGVANTVQPVIPLMISRGRGQIAIMSSIAGFAPLAHAPGYSASKAALITYGRSLRDALRTHGVKVSVICPGYVDTPMSRAESGPKPFLMSAQAAARRIAKDLARDRGIIVFPVLFGALTWLSGLLPAAIRRLVSTPFSFIVRK
jgi:short-subunit dehydrogenase